MRDKLRLSKIIINSQVTRCERVYKWLLLCDKKTRVESTWWGESRRRVESTWELAVSKKTF